MQFMEYNEMKEREECVFDTEEVNYKLKNHDEQLELIDNKFKSEEILFENQTIDGSDPMILSDFHEINGNLSYVFDQSIELSTDNMPYDITLYQNTDKTGQNFTFTKDMFSYNSSFSAWEAKYTDINQKDHYIYFNNDYNGENKIVVTYDVFSMFGYIGFKYIEIFKSSSVGSIVEYVEEQISTHTHNDYALKTEIPSIEGLATKEYVDSKLSNLSIIQITQAEYDALTTKDPNALYLITE